MMEEKCGENILKGAFVQKILQHRIVVALVVVAVIVAGVVIGAISSRESVWKIRTPYIDLVVPVEMKEVIVTDESTYGNIYTIGFYMSYGGKEQPLWRVDFGDQNAGDWIGMLRTDDGDIPVTMTGFAIGDEELAALGEDGSELYGECMQGYSVMLDGIMADSRFTTERPLAVGEDVEMKMTYWTVTLPNTMQFSENVAEGNYEAVFTAEVGGEKVRLYRVCIGEEQAGTFLGYFKIDNEKKAVSVEAFELAERGDWFEDDYAAAYRMMDTINDVIKQIVSSKQFSENK